MDAEQTSLNPSSLLDLKAELHKRYESFHRAKLIQKSDSTRHTSFKCKGEPVSKEKKSVPVVTKSSEEINEEESSLKKSRLALEAKAKLYEKIISNNALIDEEDSERYLVDFNRKVLYGTPVSAAKDKTEDSTNNLSNSEKPNPVFSNPLNTTKKINSEKPVTSYIEKKLGDKLDEEAVHYQNVQFNEVRDLGTGYFAFSMDEATRKEQMEELNTLRQQTERQRLSSQKLQKKRKAMLEARLAKVCERRNIDKNVIQTYTAAQAETDVVEDEVKDVDLSSIPLPETSEITEKKEVKIRPWDIGKTDFQVFVPEKRKKTQNDWVEDRRSERHSEFAPPSTYSYK